MLEGAASFGTTQIAAFTRGHIMHALAVSAAAAALAMALSNLINFLKPQLAGDSGDRIIGHPGADT